MANELRTLPVHASIIDPRTGQPLRAIGTLPSGRIVWPIMGGDGTDDQSGNAGGDGGQQQGDQGQQGGGGDAGQQGKQGDDDQLGDAGKRALDREREARKAAEKTAREMAAKVKEFEDKDKSESEKLAERAQTAEERAATAERQLLQMQVALEKGLPVEFAGRLVGTTVEELTADAEKLLPFVGQQSGDGGNGGGQQRRFQGGADQGAQDRGGNDTDIQAQIKAAEAKGDVRTSMRLKSALAAQQATASATT